MVERQLAARDIKDRRALAAMDLVPREHFVPEEIWDLAYHDAPLALPHEQSISQPYIVALMVQEARVGRRSRVLEVGTGWGYQTAVLATLVAHVWSIERIAALAQSAIRRLAELAITNVTVLEGDGASGYPPAAPYDAIIVAAAAPAPPAPLVRQLAMGGRLVIPLGGLDEQTLTILTNSPAGLDRRDAGGCRFVPLISPLAFGQDS